MGWATLFAALVVASAAVISSASVVPGAAASPSRATTLYAIGKPVCKRPKKAGVATCFAMKRVLVPRGTKGARPFVRAGGATAADTIGPAGGLTPSDLGTAYGLATAGGAGQTVAIVDA